MNRLLRSGIAAALFICAVAVAGCGGSDIAQPTVNAATRKAAAAAVNAKATPIARDVKDRYLRGPRKLRTRCDGGDAEAAMAGIQLKCETTAFVRPQAMYDDPNAGFSVVVTSESWVATVSDAGSVTNVKIDDGGYSISQFFQDDDANGCSVGKSYNC